MEFIPTHIILHYGEMALKGNNQPDFLNRFKRNVRSKLQSIGLDWDIEHPHGYFSIPIKPDSTQKKDVVIERLREITGLVWYAPALKLEAGHLELLSDSPDIAQIEKVIQGLAIQQYKSGNSFAVRANRSEKRFKLTSPEIERHLGSIIIENTPWKHVDLDNPDVTFYVDVTREGIYLYSEKHYGFGGLPAGITGKVLTLLSGGIDSPVAAFLAAKRGCSVDFMHFTANPMQQQEAENYKVSELARILSNYTLHSKLYLIPYTQFEFTILGHKTEYELMLFRRFMTRAGELLAQIISAQALVTGDNMAQVASQTLENIVSNSRAVDIPILRPLVTYDKMEIVDLAKQVGTYQLSLENYKDCCSIVSKHPKTVSHHNQLTQIENKLFEDYSRTVRDTLDEAVVLKYECGKQTE